MMREPFKHEWCAIWTAGMAMGALLGTDYQWIPVVKVAPIGLTIWLLEWAWWRLDLSARITAAWQGFTSGRDAR